MRKIIGLSAVVMTLALSACSGEGNSPETSTPVVEKNNEPVELTFYLYSMNEDEFNKYYVEPAKKKFPHFTLKGILPGKGNSLTELITAGTVPDIAVSSEGGFNNLLNSDFPADISELVRASKYDLSRLDPVIVDILKNGTGSLTGLPFSSSVYGLYYNKDLFDKFGEPYPVDGMTWDDVFEKARRLTRVEDGQLYRGFSDRWGNLFFQNNPYGLDLLKQNEEKADINNDSWNKLVANFERFYKMTNLSFDKDSINQEKDKLLFVEGNSAMTVLEANAPALKFNWDVVTVPVYADKPGVTLKAAPRYNVISKISKNKEAAFEFISWVTSDEFQQNLAKNGISPVVNTPEVKKMLFQDSSVYKGKHIEALTKYTFPPASKARAEGLLKGVNMYGTFNTAMTGIIIENKDRNTALRDAEEAINKQLETLKK